MPNSFDERYEENGTFTLDPVANFPGINTRQVVPWAGLRPMMPNMMPRVGRGKLANVFYNTGHGHLGWTLSAVTADMVGGVVHGALITA
jgi:D-amino-acid dehydrogenase